MKKTTTKATHRGIDIAVMSEKSGAATFYFCTNSTGKSTPAAKLFPTQGEAIANERYVIDSILPWSQK